MYLRERKPFSPDAIVCFIPEMSRNVNLGNTSPRMEDIGVCLRGLKTGRDKNFRLVQVLSNVLSGQS